ncbi:MAG: DNA/RNA nuclease SfsA [Chloroflexi bacterium]|nr:DNA/RNA nuclease SfsA [Chloroflexota bacterium]
MQLPSPLVEATFLARLNRFAALVRLNGAETLVHVANSGRLRELLQPGNHVLLARAAEGRVRKTRYDLCLVDLDGLLVSADSRNANGLACEWLQQRLLPEFQGYTQMLREQTFEDSRLDLLLTGSGPRCYVEVKSVTLVEQGAAMFPDAPTTRGRRHVQALARAVAQGHRGAVVFVVQRADADAFRPNDAADLAFGAALRGAARQGMEVYAYGCRVTLEEMTLAGRLPVAL